jgi:hypothetical protein
MNQDTVSNLYDFPAREFGTHGRWASPNSAGLAATDLTDPQSWNRFSYVLKQPTSSVDPLGLGGIPGMTAYGPGFCGIQALPAVFISAAPCRLARPAKNRNESNTEFGEPFFRRG